MIVDFTFWPELTMTVYYTALQRQKAASAHLWSKQILLFCFTLQCGPNRQYTPNVGSILGQVGIVFTMWYRFLWHYPFNCLCISSIISFIYFEMGIAINVTYFLEILFEESATQYNNATQYINATRYINATLYINSTWYVNATWYINSTLYI